jgi:hypothetical protein
MQSPMSEIGAVFKPLIIAIIFVLLISTAVLIVHLIIRTRLYEGRTMEADLSALYVKCQNYLFSSELILQEIGGLEFAEAERIAALMTDVITARYRNIQNSNMPMFLRENYPDLRNLGVSFDRLADQIVSRRQGFQNYQEQLANRIAEFEKWRTATLRGIFIAKDFPDDKLEAVINGAVVAKAEAALAKMKQLVSNQETNAAYGSGLYDAHRYER